MTYKRADLLQTLFDSFAALTLRPGRIIVVDNGDDAIVGDMCLALEKTLSEDGVQVLYAPQEKNSGGAGGFSEGTRIAYECGAEWIWLMDDDVKVFPEALSVLRPWMDRALEDEHRVIQCRRKNFDGSSFYWQYHFWEAPGIQSPIAPSAFAEDEPSRPMNTACFEGGLFHRSIIEQLGLPDPRFFIYSDDTVYGYLASKVTNPILIKDELMQRTRTLAHFRIGAIRKLNDTSDMTRYHIMRNRGYIARYLALNNDYHPLTFKAGTGFTFCKELIRLLIGKNFKSGLKELRRGMKDAKTIQHDSAWRPMSRIEGKGE